jgi:Tetratricopeptide repeat
MREQVLGAEHPDTTQSVWWLAVISQRQQHSQEAEPLYQRALAIFERVLGRDHPRTQTVRENYAALLRTMGCIAEVKRLEEAP